MGKLYTGYGDGGYTQTAGGRRVLKSDLIIELLGTIDEATSHLGAAKAYSADKALKTDIERIQKKLVSVMGEIAGGEESVGEECVSALEDICDKYFKASITEFSLPGKNMASAQLDIARAVIRRAERAAQKAAQTGRIRKILLPYINRLSDALFAMARHAEEDSPSVDINRSCDGFLDLAKEVALAVEKRAEQLNKRVVVAITDEGANLILLHSMDDAYIASRQIATDKAYTSVALKMPTHVALAESRGGKLDGLNVTDNNRLSLLGGGYPLIMKGKLVGGIGVSGGTAEEDTEFAHFGALYIERRAEFSE